ncbi:DNA polymerase III subunit beta [Leptolyngbya sp. 15MV]|nr:DNA polymerase III subunit beta [Leptolyngbya sp. 15MV]
MKVICDRAALLNAVNLISGVVAARTPRPQLTCVKLSATKSGKTAELTMSATDAEVSLRLITGQVDVQQPGEVLIPADKLRAIVSAEEGDPTLTIESEGEHCEIRGSDARFKILGYPASEFPEIPSFDRVVSAGDGGKAKAVFTHQAGVFGSMISRTLFATARENSRYAINGVLLRKEGKRLEMVATDGRRLALCRQTLAGEKDAQPVSCIVPSKALSLLLKLIDDPEQPIRVAIPDAQVLFALGGDGGVSAVLASNLVEGTFPPYEDVIPKDQDKRVVFDRDVLASAVRRAALLTNEESRGVRLKFASSDRRLELSSRAPEMGEAQINIDLAGYDGSDIEIGFNPGFITDALKVIPDPEVIMELKAPNKPGLIKSGSDFVYVVMPVSLQ